MQTVVYALFPDRAAADAALVKIERHGLSDEVVRIDEFVGDMPDEDLPGPATRSRTYALIGGVMAALIGALAGGLMGGLMFEDRLGFSPPVFAVLVGLGAGVLGALVSSIAGAAIPRRKLEALRRQIRAGSALVTIDVQSRRKSKALATELRELGAMRVGLL